MAQDSLMGPPGIGLDIGTMNIVSARSTGGKTVTLMIRDAFLDLEAEAKRSLRMSSVDYIKKEGSDDIIVIGEGALTMANLFKREARRPLSRGVISAGELDAQWILSQLIKRVVGVPRVDNEYCFYSVPAEPLDNPGQDIVYHTEVFRSILGEHGFTGQPTNEAMAIIFSQCAKEKFSGLSMSFGAGMVNIALAYQANAGLEFSTCRCLSKDFLVVTERGVKPICEMRPGEDRVLDGNGHFSEVLEVVDNGPRTELLSVHLRGMHGLSWDMTPDHRVLVKSRFGWDWQPACSLQEGSTVGIPTVRAETRHNSYYFGRKNDTNITVVMARNLGRFFGAFLGDGSCGPHAEGAEFVQIAMDLKYPELIDKYATVLRELFGGFAAEAEGFGVEISTASDDGMARIKLHSAVIARHMKKKFYNEEGAKEFPLPVHKIPNPLALGILEGLLDSDGWVDAKRRTIGNTSWPVMALVHQLLNRFGLRHHLGRRDPRVGGTNSRGVQIVGRKDELTACVSGWVSTTLFDELLKREGNEVWDQHPDFMEYEVSRVSTIPYDGHVYDLKVASEHHSFAGLGMLVHNCGDWIDQQAARAIGKTASQMCAIKEKGFDLKKPEGREQQALQMYYRAVIDHCFKAITAEFKKVANNVELPEPVPLVVSGGTTKAGSFMELFQEEFDRVRKKFPIQISEVRPASNPLTAVAEGLLVLAQEEHGGS